MSHHYSGPDFGFPHGDARLDLTDLYAFPSPGKENKTIFVMNVHPSLGVENLSTKRAIFIRSVWQREAFSGIV